MTDPAGQIAWLQACQLPPAHPGAGALCMHPSRQRCVPYFACLALSAALPAAPELAPVARAYLDWHVAHLRADGTMDDWWFTATAAYSRGRRDSEDAYAGTLLSLVAAFSATAGLEWARQHLPELQRVAGAALRLRRRDGLTWARRDWPAAFTMDNCELYRGLDDLAALLAALGAPDAAAVANAATALRRAVLQRLYDPGRQAFYYARLPLGMHAGPNWRRWIEVAVQTWPLLMGVLGPQDLTAQVLYQRTCLAFPGWPEGKTGDPYPWLAIARGALLLGDRERAERLLQRAERHYIPGSGHWYCTEAGQFIRLRRQLAPP